MVNFIFQIFNNIDLMAHVAYLHNQSKINEDHSIRLFTRLHFQKQHLPSMREAMVLLPQMVHGYVSGKLNMMPLIHLKGEIVFRIFWHSVQGIIHFV